MPAEKAGAKAGGAAFGFGRAQGVPAPRTDSAPRPDGVFLPPPLPGRQAGDADTALTGADRGWPERPGPGRTAPRIPLQKRPS